MPGGQSAVYEFTLHKEQNNGQRKFELVDVHTLLRAYCKAYTFQLERCPTNDKLHYQGRLSLFKKTTLNAATKCFPDSGIHLSPTVAENTKGAPFYCLKAQTKVEGPWTEKDYEETRVVPWPYNEVETLYPWQQDMKDYISRRVKRQIYYIVEPFGAIGKTTFVAKACTEWKPYAQRVPAMSSFEDVCQFIMSRPVNKTYLIDMPRALKKKKLAGFFAGIESVKDGWVFDKRYKGQERWFDSPNVVVFSNKKPNLKYLSRDRWRVFTIKDKRLVDYCFRDAGSKDVRIQEEDHGIGQACKEEPTDDAEVLLSQVPSEDHETVSAASGGEECRDEACDLLDDGRDGDISQQFYESHSEYSSDYAGSAGSGVE